MRGNYLASITGLALSFGASPVQAQMVTCDYDRFQTWLRQLQSDEGRITLEVEPNKKTYQVGERVRFKVQSPFAGRLLLMTIDANNVVFPVYPSVASGELKDGIKADQPMWFPHKRGYAFRTDEPVGSSRLIAIVRPPDVASFTLSCTTGLSRGKPTKLEKSRPRRRKRRRRPKPVVKSRRKKRWGYAEFKYTVIAKGGDNQPSESIK